MSKSSLQLNRETNPTLSHSLLTLIDSNPLYRQVFFSTSIEQVKDKYLVSHKICIEFFKNNLWMKDAERRGLVIKAHDGEWTATNKWNSGVANPITSRVLHLRKRYNDGYYRAKHGIASSWTRFEDITDQRKRASFKAQHPYYFLLRQLCQGSQSQKELHVPQVRPDPPARRRKRSPSTISSSSDSCNSEEEIPLSSSRRPAKKPRETYSDLLRETVTPLRALSISLPPDVPPQPEYEIIRYGMKPNIVYSSDSDPSSSSSRDSTPHRNDSLQRSVAPPSPAPSDSPSVVALSTVPDYWSRPTARTATPIRLEACPPDSAALIGGRGTESDQQESHTDKEDTLIGPVREIRQVDRE